MSARSLVEVERASAVERELEDELRQLTAADHRVTVSNAVAYRQRRGRVSRLSVVDAEDLEDGPIATEVRLMAEPPASTSALLPS